MPSYNCKHPTCANLLPQYGYCSTHQHLGEKTPEEKKQRDRQYDAQSRDKDAQKFYNSAAWRATRKNKLAQNPICELCDRRIATEVHHDVPIRSNDPEAKEKRLEYSNLLSTCSPCHKRLEAKRRYQKQLNY